MAVDGLNGSRYAAAVLAVGLASAFTAAYFAPLRAGGSNLPPEADWTLPERHPRFAEADLVKLRESRFLGMTAEVATADAPRWRLAGTAREGGGWQAMVVDEASPLQVRRLSKGQELPDGSTIVDIDADGLVSELQGCQRAFRLYSPAPPAGDCVSSKELDAPMDRSPP
jgi:hypothetical protein